MNTFEGLVIYTLYLCCMVVYSFMKPVSYITVSRAHLSLALALLPLFAAWATYLTMLRFG
jgi:uncharacterized membrane protein